MPTIRIGTFNCENLFLRYNFRGPALRRKPGETDAAYQARVFKEREEALKRFAREGAELDWLGRDLLKFDPISTRQREATAKVITENDPDIIALMEVESMEALRKFNSETFFGKKRYPYYMLIDGNDPRGIDVALLSRFPLTHLRSYIHETYRTSTGAVVPLFSRDCLVARLEVRNKPITLFINHFKSQYQDNPDRRKRQASAVARIVETTFGKSIASAYFAVVGDFNHEPSDDSLTPLLSKQWHENVLNRLPARERWTHVYEQKGVVKRVSQLDYLLCSKSLAEAIQGKPIVERRGLPRYKGLNTYYPDSAQRIHPSVDQPGTEASDHCAVFVDVAL